MLDQALKAANDREEGAIGDNGIKPLRVALIGNFPPRRCGIATFTQDVHDALTSADRPILCDVVAMSEGAAAYDYAGAVKYEVRQDVLGDYARTAAAINDSDVDVVCLQHEYGIFGGPCGEHVLTLLYNVRQPVVTTLHTILQHPTRDQRRVLEAIIARSSKLIVMAEKGKTILRDVYDVPPQKICVVPHGAPDAPLAQSDDFKPALGLQGREVLLTFGLLSPNKGIETIIRAMPAIKAARPDALYVILGATHPHLLAHEGEAYRDRLAALAAQLGVSDAVRFVNAYVDKETLLSYLRACDVYVSPYLNEAQITSGTITYAVALGRPVVSTPYWHARELLANDVGMLVDFNDSDGFAERCIALLSDAELRETVRHNAYDVGRGMIWSRLGERYGVIFADAAAPTPRRRRPLIDLPAPTLNGVAMMSDDCGMLQHSSYGVADRHHGYCIDDNARALILVNRFEAGGRTLGTHEKLGGAYAAFVNHAWNEGRGRFRNFMGYDRRWLEEEGSQDSFGRAIWALGHTMEWSARTDLRYWAEALMKHALPHARAIVALRARAFMILGLASVLATKPDDHLASALLEECGADLRAHLASAFGKDWTWFEPYIAYDNARLPEALIRAGHALNKPDWIDEGLEALSWLCALQSTPDGLFRPMGTAGMGQRLALAAPFDQQPVEAAATVDACAAALEATGDLAWLREARRAFDWYLGANDLGVAIADPVRGTCYDGLTPDRINLNQGAESILSFQLATCAMHALDRAARRNPARALSAR